MLAMLLAYHGQTLSREVLLEALWPETDPNAAINNLNQGIFQLRRFLDPTYRDGESPSYVLSDRETLGLNAELVRTDLQEFRVLAAKLQDGPEDDRPQVALAAIELVRGPFLADARYDDWAYATSVAIHSEVRSSLLSIAKGETLPQHHELGVRAASALLLLDDFDEAAQVALARRLAATGRRNAARDSITQFCRRLETELQDPPSDELLSALNELSLSAKVHPELTTARSMA
jgi:DNA-binding SARP family transcriptional activator